MYKRIYYIISMLVIILMFISAFANGAFILVSKYVLPTKDITIFTFMTIIINIIMLSVLIVISIKEFEFIGNLSSDLDILMKGLFKVIDCIGIIAMIAFSTTAVYLTDNLIWLFLDICTVSMCVATYINLIYLKPCQSNIKKESK